MHVFTSVTLNYLPKARVLATTLKKFHPDWLFHLIISDRQTKDTGIEVSLNEPFDEVIWIDDMEIEGLMGWIFKHRLVEISTAVKGMVMVRLFQKGVEKVLYLDPDIVVFNCLDDIEKLLDKYSIILTPHLLQFENEERAILDNEINSALKHGVYNLGFIAVRNDTEGRRFSDWWNRRLLNYCYDDIPNGLFTDQRWCDLIPSFFENYHILRDPGYNVASWNLGKRKINFSDEGKLIVNGNPLRFYHFTGYDSGAGDMMTQIYSKASIVVDEIWHWYRLQIDKFGQKEANKVKWYFDYFENGEKIWDEARFLYRHRVDLQKEFPNPFVVSPSGGYYKWLRTNQE